MQFRRIVVGVDFTGASLAAARWAGAHLAPDAEIVLVHVAHVPWLPSFARGHLAQPAEVTAAVGPALHGALRGLAEFVDRYRARVELVAGNPAEALPLVADELGADAICVGRGSRRRGSARFGATTTQRLLARTQLPIVIVPPSPRARLAQTIVGVDERSGGRYVLDAACRMAAGHEASVEAVHVIEPEVEAFLSRAGCPIRLAADRARAWIDALVGEVGASAARVASLVTGGDPGSAIIRRAHQSAADPRRRRPWG